MFLQNCDISESILPVLSTFVLFTHLFSLEIVTISMFGDNKPEKLSGLSTFFPNTLTFAFD